MEIEKQREQVFSEKPNVNLKNACSINKGILRFNTIECFQLKEVFLNQKMDLTFMIPASGSGSRMFEFLHNFFKDTTHKDRNKVERFLNSLNDFALTRLIPVEIKESLDNGTMDLKTFASYVVDDSGLGLGNLPKGLIPFHENSYFILNPFQEHVLQVCKSFSDQAKIHFTINKKYEEAIIDSIEQAKKMSSYHPEVSFSEQNPETDSFVYKENGTAVINEDGTYLRRPSGHGALLENLNQIESRYIFIKNIDNIQHFNHDTSVSDFALLGGVLHVFNEQLEEILNSRHSDRIPLLDALNKKYQLFLSEEDFPNDEKALISWMQRPKRVCGMVKNEGQPGGGPFWVDNNGFLDKQIVEKAQISDDQTQLSILLKSTHFNPVMIACDTYNLLGEKINLLKHADNKGYMVVEKNQNGEKVFFVEKPGLWNGGMANWITIFVEISSESFSPVKDVLNLLDARHRP
jgi:hypothetical protein